MRRILRDLKILILANLWIVPVLAGLVGALFYFVAPPPPMHARMATGAPGGGYHAFAERLRAELEQQGFELELVQSQGSRDNLAKLGEGSVELALVQSGQELTLDTEARDKLAGLGVMYREPLWLFTGRKVKFERLADLMKLRLAIGSEDSGTQAVAAALFAANRIEPGAYPEQWQQLGGSRAADALVKGELDAAFFVGPAENPLIQRLAAEPELRLVSLRRTEAYLARLPYLSRLEVGEGMLDMARNTPERDIVTLGPVATLVAGESFHPSLTPLILEATKTVLKNGSLLDPAGSYPARPPLSLRTLSEADYYYDKGLPILQRYLPFRIASLADRYIILAIPLLVLLFPLFKAIGPIYQWRIRARIYRWYKHLREIDQQLYKGSLNGDIGAEIERLEKLEDELARVEVPLSYSSELYELHMHLRYMIERLHAVQRRQASAAVQ
ncbi:MULTISPECIES: TAXI family TRAP transporter solute-binding subunit [unclassified Pseudomonas]|uniref:TAXI family TRAP transporter solute-binding subunit n=1 Tax=unclassified Pseudomonas TaxID=196821 RepID=UPI00244B44CD|nr:MULTISPECIES: TAXI family TRAP transporter solute-binding subunit [unclassified Pseudomonas]MDG9925526.1 PhnD/SsuA/transferrin family substrate-binding protein [Pseudomonas sp. GD04045]MDH0034033.1 PhnD/SsuA/transferrin family substrate-binding protein [Pseudomonas sp. GD04019]